MGLLDMLLVGVGLSMDAFAVSVCKGLASRKINWLRAFATALSFGGFQALMPLLGWLLGSSILPVIEPIDHWIAFALLVGIGVKMLWDAFHADGECESDDASTKRFLVELIVLSVATSIDALVAGVSFAMASIDIWVAIAVIGITTFTLSLAGTLLGNRFGAMFQKPASIVGGAALILLGLKILLEHLDVI